jgi:hypothetical protein
MLPPGCRIRCRHDRQSLSPITLGSMHRRPDRRSALYWDLSPPATTLDRPFIAKGGLCPASKSRGSQSASTAPTCRCYRRRCPCPVATPGTRPEPSRRHRRALPRSRSNSSAGCRPFVRRPVRYRPFVDPAPALPDCTRWRRRMPAGRVAERIWCSFRLPWSNRGYPAAQSPLVYAAASWTNGQPADRPRELKKPARGGCA